MHPIVSVPPDIELVRPVEGSVHEEEFLLSGGGMWRVSCPSSASATGIELDCLWIFHSKKGIRCTDFDPRMLKTMILAW